MRKRFSVFESLRSNQTKDSIGCTKHLWQRAGFKQKYETGNMNIININITFTTMREYMSVFHWKALKVLTKVSLVCCLHYNSLHLKCPQISENENELTATMESVWYQPQSKLTHFFDIVNQNMFIFSKTIFQLIPIWWYANILNKLSQSFRYSNICQWRKYKK